MTDSKRPKMSLFFPDDKTKQQFEISIREAGFQNGQAYLRFLIERDMKERKTPIHMGNPQRGGYRERKG